MALILNKLDVPSERLPVTILVRQKSVKRPVEVIPWTTGLVAGRC